MSAAQQYRQNLRSLSDRLVSIQSPIRILDAIKWPASLRQTFLAGDARQLPNIERSYYESLSLSFDIARKQTELKDLRADIHRQLGRQDKLGDILVQTVEQYLVVLELIRARGTPEFGQISRRLYGSAHDRLSGDRRTLREVGEQLCSIFSQPAAQHIDFAQAKEHDARAAVTLLRQRLSGYFPSEAFRVIETDGIVSDAAAGGDSIKLNTHAKFSDRDLRVLEVHEGWVHVGTTLNGRRQPYATWLSVGSPRIAAMQEGLALLLETLTFSSFPLRARRVSDRVTAIYMAENGADFVEVYRHLTERGLPQYESYSITQRVFRGGMVTGGSVFTKDLSYVLGFVENVNFIRSAIAGGLPELIPMMFLGKLTLDDIPALYEAYLEGIIDPPHYLPTMFRDLSGLYVWFGFSNGMALVDMKRVQKHYLKSLSSLRPSCPLTMAPRPISDIEID